MGAEGESGRDNGGVHVEFYASIHVNNMHWYAFPCVCCPPVTALARLFNASLVRDCCLVVVVDSGLSDPACDFSPDL